MKSNALPILEGIFFFYINIININRNFDTQIGCRFESRMKAKFMTSLGVKDLKDLDFWVSKILPRNTKKF